MFSGQLTHALRTGSVDVYYYYDSAGRLLTRRDNYRSTVQFLYADISVPDRITHVYNFTSRVLSSLTYDDRGMLVSVDAGL